MLIPYKEIVKKYNIRPKGVLHLGANEGQELKDYYENGVERSVWIEALPDIYEKLVENCKKYPNTLTFNTCIDKEDNKVVSFNVASNNGESSSILKFKTHTQVHPEVRMIGTIGLLTKRLDTLFKENNLSFEDYEFINFDIQGKELDALKSMGDNLKYVKYAYLEVNFKELYEGVPLVEEIDEYLGNFGLKRVETAKTGFGWSDALYIKKYTTGTDPY